MKSNFELLDNDGHGNWVCKTSLGQQWVDDMIQALIDIPSSNKEDPLCQAYVVSNADVTTTGPLSIQRVFKAENIKNKKWLGLLSEFNDVVTHTVKNAFNKQDSFSLKMLKSWAIEGGKNTYHTLHYHLPHDTREKVASLIAEKDDSGLTKYVSVVCYLSVPDLPVTDLERQSGRFVYIKVNDLGIPEPRHVQPQIGDVLVFPSSLLHGSYPHSKGLRQTFSCDYEALNV